MRKTIFVFSGVAASVLTTGAIVALVSSGAPSAKVETGTNIAAERTGAAGAAVTPAASRVSLKPARPLNAEVRQTIAAFSSPTAQTRAAKQADPLLVAAQASESGISPGSGEARLDYARAVPVKIANSAVKAWIVPAGDKVCTAIEDVVAGGTGGSCSTIGEIKAGEAITSVQVSPSNVLVLQVVADGGEIAKTVTPGGTIAPLGTRQAGVNAVGAVVPAESALAGSSDPKSPLGGAESEGRVQDGKATPRP